MASGKVFLLAALCSFIILSTFISSTQSTSCCLRYVRPPVKSQQLLGYTIQTINNSCDIPAVIFHLPGKFLCTNPSNLRTQKLMKTIDERKRKISQIGNPGYTTSA
ncbi:C-C motif chemokine 20-like [Plectropomus leopardus]|uniref:C-C motif chemokine 20b n=1 Tax=Plectropomus leopardus TaxID=160734 RepID=UPI001C4BF371|nr:C-C motif chemokine 20b [Plectropomus leopardus]XP_042372839.1 C-C motif chemokine 20-like [Plectropomus leopardus]